MTTRIEAASSFPQIVDPDTGIYSDALDLGQTTKSFGVARGTSEPYGAMVNMAAFEKQGGMSFANYDYDNHANGVETSTQYLHSGDFDTTSYAPAQTMLPTGLPSTSDVPLLSAESLESSGSFNSDHIVYPSYVPLQAQTLPRVASFSPMQGPGARKMYIYLNGSADLENPSLYCSVNFGAYRSTAMLERAAMGQNHHQSNYVLTVNIPSFISTGSAIARVNLTLLIGDTTPPIHFGEYLFTDATACAGSVSPSDATRKRRKLSLDTIGPMSNKRASTLPPGNDFSSPSPESATAAYSAGSQYRFTPTKPRQFQSDYSTPRFGMSPSLAASHLGVGPSAAAYGQNVYSSPTSAGPTSSPTANQTGQGGSNPALVRTSTLQYEASGAPHSASVSYNTYGNMYNGGNKAILKLMGDLNKMAENWTPDENAAHRRLVRFRRSQVGSTINASFEPVTPEDHARAPGNIYVNCIYWQEKQTCYITSVDTIQLLEALVAVRFTVEEKNRIRRNLEGFRPATVSKARPECEEFFKIIMGFPSPKPRNIEKDVKVFPWRILANALRKIIGKYSASYSSSATMPSMGASDAMNAALSRSATPATAATYGSPGLGSMLQQTQSAPMVVSHAQVGENMGGMGGMGLGQAMSWHTPATQYTTDVVENREPWNFSDFPDMSASQTVGPDMQQFGQPTRFGRLPSISANLGYAPTFR